MPWTPAPTRWSWSAATAWCTSGSTSAPARPPGSPSWRPAPATTSPATSACPSATRGRRSRCSPTGGTRRIDLGRVSDGVVGETWFGGVLGAGFDAVVNARAQRMRWPHGQMRYNLAVLRELPVFRPIPYAIELDGRRIETRAMLVAVANTTVVRGRHARLSGRRRHGRALRRHDRARAVDRGVPPGLPQGLLRDAHHPSGRRDPTRPGEFAWRRAVSTHRPTARCSPTFPSTPRSCPVPCTS